MDVEMPVGPTEGESGKTRSTSGVGCYDEFWESTETPRPIQRRLLEYVERQTPEELRRLSSIVRRRIHEHEVTFNILGAPEGTTRPWQVGPLPLILSHEDFSTLRVGLSQRARVLNAMLADLYGERRLLKEGVVPPRLVYGNPNFWRACVGISPLGGQHLHLFAADLGRQPDGRFVVFSDRTAAPAGAGYALENRLVVGRTLDALFREYSVQRLHGFFEGVGRMVQRIAATTASEPRVVMLTPGMHDESSFEHAYLSRYLGFELVEGRDLTVRNDAVYLKTLAGLRKVDVILRRVFDSFCDPLELREDSVQGIAGLVGAARAGQVAVANPLGSGLVESPVFKAFIPQVARCLLGEELQLESVPTRWLGDPNSLAEVVGSLDEWIVKPAFGERVDAPTRPSQLTSAGRDELRDLLLARPEEFVAERWPPLSVTQFWDQSALAPGQVSLRMFLHRDENDYQVLPGGLARVDSTPDGLFLKGSKDRSSVDVWVPSPIP